MYNHVLSISQRPSLYTNHTDWDAFRETLDERLNLAIPLQTPLDIEDAVETLTVAIQQAAWRATPPLMGTTNPIWLPSNSKTETTGKTESPKKMADHESTSRQTSLQQTDQGTQTYPTTPSEITESNDTSPT